MEVSAAVRHIYVSLGFKRLIIIYINYQLDALIIIYS